MRHMRWLLGAALAAAPACDRPAEPSAATASSPADPGLDDSTSGGPVGGAATGDPPPDMPPALECDPWEQKGCADGEKCNMFSTRGDAELDSARCVPLAAPPRQVDESCIAEGGYGSGVDDCAAGLMCWAVGGPLDQGVCVPLCNGCAPDPQCPEGRLCAKGIGSFHYMCLPECDPLLQNCIEGDACVLVGAGFVCVQDGSGFEGQIYDPCLHANACDPGLACMPGDAAVNCDAPEGEGCCLPLCTIGASPCPDMLECVPLFDPGQFPDYAEVGICMAAP